MSWSKPGRNSGQSGRDRQDGPRGYHHGNLKEALLRAALELIAQKGPAGFTFAEAARWAGVSPAAPYRHFRDRDELLTNVALRGFERFETVLGRAWDDGRPAPFAALDRLGKAYLEFARAEPAYYSAMFEAGIPLAMSSRAARGCRSRLCGAARSRRKNLRIDASAAAAAGLDGGAAYLGDVARRRFAVRARRCRTAAAAYVG